jgi:hypothetical protein
MEVLEDSGYGTLRVERGRLHCEYTGRDIIGGAVGRRIGGGNHNIPYKEQQK